MRKAAYHPKEKEVYLPAAGTKESEMMVQLFAMSDGQTVIQEQGHAYVSSSWIKKMYPRMKGTVEQIEARIFAEMETKGL